MNMSETAIIEAEQIVDEDHEPIEKEKLEQMSLVIDGEKLYVDRNRPPKRYTGEGLLRDQPRIYALAVKLLAGQGNPPLYSDRDMAGLLGISRHTLTQVRLREVKEITAQREILRQKHFVADAVLGERVLEVAAECKDLKALAIAQGINATQFLALSGLPAQHIKVDHTVDVTAPLREFLEKAEEKMRQAKARVVEPEQLESGEA